MRSVFSGAVCREDVSARLAVLNKTRRLNESATSAMAMLSLRCLFFTKPSPMADNASPAPRRTPV